MVQKYTNLHAKKHMTIIKHAANYIPITKPVRANDCDTLVENMSKRRSVIKKKHILSSH